MTSVIVVVGGYGRAKLNTVEVIGDKECSIPELPYLISEHPSVIITNDMEILICGGHSIIRYDKKCLELKEGQWVFHSNMSQARIGHASITMSNGTYILGSYRSQYTTEILPSGSKFTTEFLPTGSKVWQEGPQIPHPGMALGCVVKKSDYEMILIGGINLKKKIIQYNTKTNEWKTLGELQIGRYGHACSVFDGKIFVVGGLRERSSFR